MKKLRLQKGFTLVETLVAIFILSLAIAGAMTAVQLGLQSSYYARDQIVAFYLGEEAIENVRNIRDQNWNTGQDSWLHGIDDCIGDGVLCRVDAKVQPAVLEKCGGSTGKACLLNFDKSSGIYSYAQIGGNVIPSKYTRTIHVDQGTEPNQILITVIVNWNTGTFTNRSLTFREELYNWNGSLQ